MKKAIWYIVIVVILLVFILPSALFTVDQTESAVVLRFGEIVRVITEPGLYYKQPFVDTVVKYDKRILLYDIEPEKIITSDKKTLVIDTYALWRIADPKKFLTSMRDVRVAKTRIDDVVYSHIRDVFAKSTFDEVVSKRREELLKIVTNLCRKDLEPFGIEVIDVRVKHADLPEENAKAVYNRMKAERYSIAAKIRAEGEKAAVAIKAEADKKAKIILAEARRKAEVIKGTGEASAAAVYAQAYSKDPEFYDLWRRLQILENLKVEKIILGKDARILRDLK